MAVGGPDLCPKDTSPDSWFEKERLGRGSGEPPVLPSASHCANWSVESTSELSELTAALGVDSSEPHRPTAQASGDSTP